MPLLLLVLLHLWLGLRLLAPWPPVGQAVGAALLVLLFAGVLSSILPIVRRRAATRGIWAWAGFIAMGLFSDVFVLTVLRDVGLIGWHALHALGALPPVDDAARQASSLAVPALALAGSAVGLWNARRTPPLRRVQVPIDGLPPALHGLVIVQITDLHVGPTIGARFVQRVVRRANAAGADLIVLTGDLADGHPSALAPGFAPLADLRAPLGVFGVTGNHEYYSGVHGWLAAWRAHGITPLLNEHRVLRRGDASFVLAGVPDWSAAHFDPAHAPQPEAALLGAPAGVPRILLAHQPRSAAAADAAGFHLQLSGHTHGGQFLPWRWFVPLQQPYVAGLHRHGGLWVWVSRGTGYWGPPKRLGAPSEISRLELVPSPGTGKK
ncbi:metallophosphoesterase [Aquabacterium sp. J223]|uniref:metallophosphoesterase n=1 Tax=Aquabacterium sp. J223 TaxID=2898431 RepID=UPI0021AD5B69|nr:metallophosphoesterase [Aquabacterium sp. J223]UUX97447.1 metallophosphoesterase [Aquabacterium sp. J223]